MIIYSSACLLTISIIYLVVKLFKYLGIVDSPDGIRKIHKGPVPLGGGIALFLAANCIFLIFPESYANLTQESVNLLKIWYLSSLVLILGLIDDIKPLPVFFRLISQILVSWLVIITTDVYVRDLGDILGTGNLFLDKLGIPITIFMVVGICNSFNMIDGMDGFVGFVSLVAAGALAIIAFMANYSGFLFIPVTLLGVFLIFNLGLLGKDRKLFLGDSGALWLGFLVAWVLVFFSQGENRILNPVHCLWLVTIPLIDALTTFLKRLTQGKSMFSGDRKHIHHLLLDSGMKKWKVLLVFLLISLAASFFAIISILFQVPEYLMFFGFITLWFFYFLILKERF